MTQPFLRRTLSGLAGLLLAGCAAFQPPPLAVGQGESELVALLGPATGRYAMAEGMTRLEFASGPYGRQTWMVDLGPDGRSRRFEQVLTLRNLSQFAERAPGMGTDELLRTLGRPGHRQPVGWLGVVVWSWRYPTSECLWWQVSVGADGKAIDAGQGIDPMCDVKDPR